MATTDTSTDHSDATYPVLDFNNYQAGPVLSHVEGMDRLRDEGPFVFSTFGPQGHWVFTEPSMIRAALQHPEIFSSSVVTPLEVDPPYKWIPEMLDPPEHTKWRQLLAPHFAPKLMEQMEGRVRERCVEIIESFADRGHCNFLGDFAWRYPTTIFMEIMGLPLDGLDQFLAWEHDILHLTAEEDPDRSKAVDAMIAVQGYFAQLIEVKRTNPREDLLTAALGWQIDGEPISEADMLSWCLLMFMAGLDTVSIQLSYAFWYLAEHPEVRARLASEPALAGPAVEEFLRAFAFVAPSRKVMEETEFEGCPLKRGDMVLLPLSTVCRDPEAFADPFSIQLDRAPNNHIAFGLGPHRCLGSHLARRELRVALEEWHRRIPDYHLTEGVEVIEHGGMYGIDVLQLSW
jgi:cytochrome P450